MLCYRCGSHVPDTADSCGTCGQKLSGGGVRQTTATFSRRRLQNSSVENAPYKPGDVVADRYEIKDVVGAGPVGFVFRAADRQVDVEVALKVITPRLVQTPDERRQFAKAIRLGRKLSHQNLIRVYEEGEDQDRPFFTMQFLEGLTLRKIIDLRAQKNEYFALREIEPILGQIAHALDGAHKVGAHSNLKPENVIVLPDLLKVADFGLALAIPHLPFVQAAKQRKADRYLAPEYVQGHEVDQRADLYSLGVIIGEMLSGLTPDGAIPELARRNPEVPPQLEGLYRKALNSNPLARPKTATELFQEFAEITRRVSPPPLKKGPEAPAPAVSRSRPAMAPPLAASSSATETVEFRRRVVEKPPPPVPDIESIEVPINGNSHEELSPDATQPISSSSIPVPPPPPDDAHETLVMPAVVEPELLPELVGEPTESRPIPGTERSSRAGVWFFVMFTLLGLSLGAAGGYWLLKRSRQPAQPIAMPGPGTDGAATGATGATGISGTTGAVVAAGPNGPTGGTGPNLQLDPGGQPNADPGAAEKQRAEEAKRLAEERKKIDDAATAAAQKNELLRVQEEKRKAEEARKAAEAERLAEERRLAEENRKAEEAAAKLAEQKRRAEEKKPETVAAAAVAPKPGCPDGMKLIHAGSFKMGTARNDPMMGFDEKILASTSVSAFCIDYYEYPNRRGATPKVGVSWTEAKRSCEARGKRLCSEEEWEKACKGPGNARYPYGNTYDADACNTEDELGEDRPLATSGRFSKCRSGYGIADMSGNAAEWTASAYAGNADKAQKGGSFSKPDYAARCSARKNGSPGSRGSDVGFRCCADP